MSGLAIFSIWMPWIFLFAYCWSKDSYSQDPNKKEVLKRLWSEPRTKKCAILEAVTRTWLDTCISVDGRHIEQLLWFYVYTFELRSSKVSIFLKIFKPRYKILKKFEDLSSKNYVFYGDAKKSFSPHVYIYI